VTERARIGVIGTGWWSTQAHLPALRDYARAELVAVADPTEARLEAASRAYGIEKTYADYRALLERERPDGVVIAVPHTYHYEIARDALDAGASVLLEKPMTLRSEEADELVRLAAERGLHLMVGYTFHFNPHARALREAFRARRLGNLQLVTALFASTVIEFLSGRPESYRDMFDYPVTGPQQSTYSDPSIAGGGQGQTQVTHAAALLFWLTGLVPIEVSAYMDNHGLAVDLIDAMAVRFDGGALGTVASTGAVAKDRSDQLEYRIHGTEGVAVVDFIARSAEIHDNDGGVERLPDVRDDEFFPLYEPARHLADLILGAVAENQAPGEIGALTVAFLAAAYRSAREGTPQKIGVEAATRLSP
jgi:predicted dehydrogenase